MKYKLNVDGGGIFSKYMVSIKNLVDVRFDDIYLNIVDNRTNNNMFDFILNQKIDDSFTEINCSDYQSYNNVKKIEESKNFIRYKEIINNLNFKKELLDKITYFQEKLNINENTIGVHIRLTDMNIHHQNDYGLSNFDSYLKFFNNHDEYFVSSDNKESIDKLIEIFGDKIKFVPNLIRGEHEIEDTFNLQIQNFKNPYFWEEAFIEMFLLSKCSSLICRTSSLSNATILHSDTIKNIIRV